MSSSQSNVLLEYYLKKLKLPAVSREYQSMAAKCCADRSDFPTYLLRLFELESIEREQRSADR